MSPNPKPPGSEPIRLSAETDFALGDLQIRPSVREAICGGRLQHVEPRVMQVLVALVHAAGAVVSRDDLIQSCWEGRVVGEAAINRCIFKLRELADAGDGRTYFHIETIARVGYRLEPVATIGHDHAASIPPPVVKRNRSAAIALAAAVGGLTLLAIAFLAWKQWTVSTPPDAVVSSTDPSIAVLPFKNLSSEADAAYFAAGIQDEILTRLAKIGSLKVISRTSADRMAERPGSLKDIARQLGVANILEGSVQSAGDTVRVNVQLIRVASDDHLWAEDYDRRLDDVLSVESEIAGAIATALAAKITPSESEALGMQPTLNRQAYDLYLRGLVLFRKGGAENLKVAASSLEQAVDIDPTFAVAWALLSRANAFLYFGGDGGDERRVAARRALDKALALKPGLVEVELADGMYKYHVGLDFAGARRAFETLHSKWPNNVEVLQSLGLISRRLGHWPESVAYFREVVALDPLVPNNYTLLATTLQLSRNPAEGVKLLDGAQELWPDDTDLLTQKIDLLQQMGELDRADAALERLHPAKIDAYTLWLHRVRYGYRRKFGEGLRYFEDVRARPDVPTWTPVDRAFLDLILGDFRRQNGDTNGAKASYAAALDTFLGLLKEQPDNTDLLTPVSIAYSGLGDKELAMRYADHAAVLHPLSEDPVDGPGLELYRAIALARLGDRDAAIPLLTRLLKIPGSLTTEILRLDPDFDALRGDPRFERLANDTPVKHD
jgi:TolB-like protein/DNA-binding winged helix-turn-helix (wHTH) protein